MIAVRISAQLIRINCYFKCRFQNDSFTGECDNDRRIPEISPGAEPGPKAEVLPLN